MKRSEFYKLNTIYGDKHLSDDYCKDLFDYFVYGGKIFGYDVNISFDDFSRIFTIISNNIGSKLSNDEIKKAFLQYVQLIMADARSGKVVDVSYFVNCVDYFCLDILDNSFLKKVKKDVKQIRASLVSEFSLSKNRSK